MKSSSHEFKRRSRPKSIQLFFLILSAIFFGGILSAQAHVAMKYCWIDAKTGKSVPTGPGGWLPGGGTTAGGRFSNPDSNHVEDSKTGRTYVNDPNKGWIDAKTGESVPTGPGGWLPGGGSTAGGRFSNPDSNHVEDSKTGRTYVRVPCLPRHGPSRHASAPSNAAVPVLPFSFSIGIGGIGHGDKEK